MPPPPPGGSGPSPETAPVASSIASGRLFATATFVPFTTMTSFSSGTADSCLARTYIGRTYRIESSIGIVSRSPNCTSEPPLPSSVRAEENAWSELMRENTRLGPSTSRPAGSVNATSSP